jgi:hypothetical protein
MKKIEFMGWKNCVELNSGKFKIIVTTDVGPRIIGAFLGESDNLVYVDPSTAGNTVNKKDWLLYGGHRLWHSPEEKPRSYVPDNRPVDSKKTKEGIMFSSGIEPGTGIYKSYTIKPLGKERFRIIHRIRNHNMWDIEIAAWALTVMAPGGTAVIPQPQGNKKALLPNRYLTLWPYTNMADKRFTWGEKYTLLQQDAKAKTNCKIGLNCEDSWLAYANNGVALRKRFEHLADAEYPDNGCSIEVFTNSDMLEIETLSPLYLLAPEEEIVHIEEWEAFSVGDILTEKDAAKYFK